MHRNQTWGIFYPTVNPGSPLPIGDHVPLNILTPGHLYGSHLQDFQYFVVIDFEATCDKDKVPNPQEIIEFPSVLVNSRTGQLEASFQTYVRPVCHPILTDFCKDLTGIQQNQVDEGVSLGRALLMHDGWLERNGVKCKNFAVVTWSNWDCRVMLESECKFKKISKPPYFNRWIDLKVPFQQVFQGKRCNLQQAVQHAGLTWEGRTHCGLDDACNTARLLAHFLYRGFKFSITNWMERQSAPVNQPTTFQNQELTTISSRYGNYLHPFFYNERRIYCFCGVLSTKCQVRKPGPNCGRFFFGCGNWSTARHSSCPYFEWV